MIEREIAYVNGDSIRIRTKKMILGIPYTVQLNGKNYAIVKPQKNVIDIYLENVKDAAEESQETDGTKVNKLKPASAPKEGEHQ